MIILRKIRIPIGVAYANADRLFDIQLKNVKTSTSFAIKVRALPNNEKHGDVPTFTRQVLSWLRYCGIGHNQLVLSYKLPFSEDLKADSWPTRGMQTWKTRLCASTATSSISRSCCNLQLALILLIRLAYSPGMKRVISTISCIQCNGSTSLGIIDTGLGMDLSLTSLYLDCTPLQIVLNWLLCKQTTFDSNEN